MGEICLNTFPELLFGSGGGGGGGGGGGVLFTIVNHVRFIFEEHVGFTFFSKHLEQIQEHHGHISPRYPRGVWNPMLISLM